MARHSLFWFYPQPDFVLGEKRRCLCAGSIKRSAELVYHRHHWLCGWHDSDGSVDRGIGDGGGWYLPPGVLHHGRDWCKQRQKLPCSLCAAFNQIILSGSEKGSLAAFF